MLLLLLLLFVYVCGLCVCGCQGCPGAVHEVMLDCWHKELSQRPTFGEILKRLDLLLHTES